jgi:hypothetical protein
MMSNRDQSRASSLSAARNLQKSLADVTDAPPKFGCPGCGLVLEKAEALVLATDYDLSRLRSAEDVNAARMNLLTQSVQVMAAATGKFDEAMTQQAGDAFLCPKCKRKLSVARAWAGQYPATSATRHSKSGPGKWVLTVLLIALAVGGAIYWLSRASH